MSLVRMNNTGGIKKIFYIEGNISCGKTTVIENLRLLGYLVFEEPLNVWQTEYVLGEHNILDLFYSDMKKWGFKFEMVSMMTRYKQLKAALDVLTDGGGSEVGNNVSSEGILKTNVVFIERSLLTDRHIFALNLYHNGIFDELEWKIYCDWHDLFMDLVRKFTSSSVLSEGCLNKSKENVQSEIITEYIYIQTPPEECFTRKIGRARIEENDVAPTYFQELHDKHEEWLTSGWVAADKASRVHIIRGYGTREEVLTQIINILGSDQLIKQFVNWVDGR